MPIARNALCLALTFLLSAGLGALQHRAAWAGGTATSVEVSVDPDMPAVVRVAQGAHVRLSLAGAAGRELHLHGYDLRASAPDGAPVVFEFDAVSEGRFAVEMHVADDLLGRHERPVLWVEVLEP